MNEENLKSNYTLSKRIMLIHPNTSELDNNIRKSSDILARMTLKRTDCKKSIDNENVQVFKCIEKRKKSKDQEDGIQIPLISKKTAAFSALTARNNKYNEIMKKINVLNERCTLNTTNTDSKFCNNRSTSKFSTLISVPNSNLLTGNIKPFTKLIFDTGKILQVNTLTTYFNPDSKKNSRKNMINIIDEPKIIEESESKISSIKHNSNDLSKKSDQNCWKNQNKMNLLLKEEGTENANIKIKEEKLIGIENDNNLIREELKKATNISSLSELNNNIRCLTECNNDNRDSNSKKKALKHYGDQLNPVKLKSKLENIKFPKYIKSSTLPKDQKIEKNKITEIVNSNKNTNKNINNEIDNNLSNIEFVQSQAKSKVSNSFKQSIYEISNSQTIQKNKTKIIENFDLNDVIA